MNIDLFITQNCNLACVFCGAWKEKTYLEQKLDFIKRAITVAHSNGYKFVTLSGGEPFMHPNIFEIITFANQIGMWVNITTNGLLITQETLDKLKNLSVNLRISLHSLNEEKYNEIVRVNAFHRVMETINLLKENNFYYSIGTTIFSDNMDEISDIIAFAFQNHAQYVRFSPVVGIMDGESYTCNRNYYVAMLQEICKNLIQYRQNIAIEKNTFVNKKFLLEYMCTRPCPAASKSFIILDSDENLIPCQFVLDVKYKKKFTDINSFYAMYDMKEKVVSTIHLNKESACGKCLYMNKCKGGCWANKLTSGCELNAEQPICALSVVTEAIQCFNEETNFLVDYWYTHFKIRYNEKDGTYCFRKLPFWEVNFQYFK